MTTFTDDFERADGDIDNDWTATPRAVTIASGVCQSAGATRCYRTPFAWTETQRVRISSGRSGSTGNTAYAMARYDNTGPDYWRAGYAISGGNAAVTLVKVTGGTGNQVASESLSGFTDGFHDLEIVDTAGVITVLLDTQLAITYTDNAFSDHAGAGFYHGAAAARTASFYADDVGVVPTLTVTPDPVEQIGPDPTLSLTGTDTAWDVANNTPVFTVDVGSVISQEVTSETTATLNYALPHVTDTLTVTDPSTNAQAQVALDSTLGLDLELDLSPVLDILGTPQVGHTVTGDQTTLLGEMVMPETPPSVSDIVDWFVAGFLAGTVPEALLDKLNELYGILPTDQQILSLQTLAQVELSWLNRNLDLLTDDVASISGEEELSLRAVINAIAGVPNITTSEVKALIDALTSDGYWDLAGIKAQLDLIRGDPPADLAAIFTAISALSPVDLSPVTDRLDYISSTGTVNLAAIIQDIADLDIVVDDVQTDLNNGNSYLTSGATINLQTLKTLLENIHDDLAADWLDLANDLADHNTNLNTKHTAVMAELSDIFSQGATTQGVVSDIHEHVSGLANTDLTHVNAELDTIKEMLAALASPAPIWPGQANVTLGTAVPLTSDLRITGTIDGVIVQLESVPHKLSNFPMGDSTYSYRLGFITFEADAGWLEPWQYLGFDSALYCPRQMKHAAAVRIRYLGDAVGTAQPWSTA